MSLKTPARPPLFVGSCETPALIDETDARILEALSDASGFESLRDVSRTLALPFSTLDRRVKRLQEEKVVQGFVYEIDEKTLGMQRFRLLVLKKGICANTRAKLLEFCTNHPHVTFLIESLGAWDFEIGIEVAHAEEVTRFSEALYGVCGMRIAWAKVLLEGEVHKHRALPQGPTLVAR